MKRSTVLVSVVVPIYNEGEILPELISRIEAAVSSYAKAYEIIIIDDYSTDGTGQFFKELQNPHVIYQKKTGRRGKGYSLTQGFAITTRGNFFFFF